MFRKVGLPLVVLACLLATGCKGGQPAAAAGKPPEVIVAYPVEQSITDTEEFPGRIDAVNTVQVKSRVQGYLTEVDFVDGQEVKEGDLLAIIQKDPYEAQLKAAKAQVALNEALLRIARITLERNLSSGVAVSRLELDQNQAQVEQCDANLKLAKANLETAELNMGWTEVRAPISGRLSRRLVDPGNIVLSDNVGGANATILTTVVSLDPVYVYFDIDERTMLRLERLGREKNIPVPWKTVGGSRAEKGAVAGMGKAPALDRRYGTASAGIVSGGLFPRKLGMPVAVGLADEPSDEFRHQGVINFVDNVVNRQTGTLRLRGEFDNPDRLLKAGMYCRVAVPIGTPHPAILVAEKALGTDQGRKYVYVVDGDDVVSQRDVKVGALHDGLRVVEGVGVHERVVVEGLQRVKPKLKVTAKLDEMPKDNAAKELQLVNNPPRDNGAKSSAK
jgi:RND family efflux transporter MFP subunit